MGADKELKELGGVAVGGYVTLASRVWVVKRITDGTVFMETNNQELRVGALKFLNDLAGGKIKKVENENRR